MPNDTVLKQKKAIVNELAESIRNSASGVLAEYKGITVENDTALRRELRKAGVHYRVVKNTLLSRALEQVGMDDLKAKLVGTTALATSDNDMVAPAKILAEYSKKTRNAFKIKGGFVEGGILDTAGVTALAELPSKEQLIARVLGGFNAPISGFVNVLNGNIRGLVVALNAIAEQKQSA